MAYNSNHTGPEIDAAVALLGDIQTAKEAAAASATAANSSAASASSSASSASTSKLAATASAESAADSAAAAAASAEGAAGEPTIPAGTSAQYWRGDKTWQTLNKAAAGLSNVDNTADTSKPVSTAQQTALDGKLGSNGTAAAAIKLATSRTINGVAFDGTTDITIVAGGLPDVVESKNTTAPNATVPVVQLSVSGAEVNIDFALAPKGNGAIAAQAADGTAAGGNKRGANAVDWQSSRAVATRVASGGTSVISGGNNNTASGASSTVSGGFINAASGLYSTISGGGINTASGAYSTVLGGYRGTTRGLTGAMAWAGFGANDGQSQTEQFLLRGDTTTAAATRITTDGAVASVLNGPILPNTSTYHCRIRVLARDMTTGDSKSWSGVALIRREANAASTAFIGTPTLSSDFASAGMSGCVAALNADTTLGGLGITVTGLAATSIRWVAHVETLEVTN